MNRISKLRASMAVSIISTVVVMLTLFGLIISIYGFMSFTEAFREEYSTTTYHMADTAAALVNGNHIEDYLEGRESEEYQITKQRLDVFSRKMNVSLVYVIQVDTSDYGRFVSIFNSVNNSVDETEYTEWELGYRRDTTNDEYRQKYEILYNQGAVYETVYRLKGGTGYHPHITTLVPVRDDSENVTALLCIQRPVSEFTKAAIPYLIRVLLSLVLFATAACLIIARFFKRHIVDPIRKTATEATRFAKENTKEEPLGAISRYEEIVKLAAAIDTMETDMVGYIENLTAITAEKERIGAELSLASKIQENSVPNVFPAFPERHDLDIYALMKTAKEVGGDFYNFFLLDEDHLAMVIGDVSGKGVGAALFMMVVNILISDRARMGGTPAEILSHVNRVVCERNTADMFVTVWLGILELSTGKVTAVNAGHDDAAICRANGSFELLKTKHGIVTGVFPEIKYKDFSFELQKGDKLFLYTDGVPEATDSSNEMFRMERMLDALNLSREKTPEEILQKVKEKVDEFVGDAPQFDDLTMLCMERK